MRPIPACSFGCEHLVLTPGRPIAIAVRGNSGKVAMAWLVSDRISCLDPGHRAPTVPVLSERTLLGGTLLRMKG